MSTKEHKIDALLHQLSADEPDEHFGIAWIHAYLTDDLNPDQLAHTKQHLATCPRCQQEVQATRQRIAELDADPTLKDRLWSRIVAGIDEAVATQPEPLPSPFARLQEFISALAHRTSQEAAMVEQLFTDACAALLSSLGASPAYAGSRSGSAVPHDGENSDALAPIPADPFIALRKVIAHAFAAETINSTFPGQEYDLQIRRLPGQAPVLRVRPPGKNWQPFALIASDSGGQELRLDSTGDSLPLNQLAGLPGHFTKLSISFV